MTAFKIVKGARDVMRWSRIVREIYEKEGYTQQRLATALGLKGQNRVAEMLRHKGIGLERFVRIMDVMGYEVVVRKRSAGPKGKGVYVVSEEEDE